MSKAPDVNIRKLIVKTSETTALAMVTELKKQNLIKDKRFSAFQKTEHLLYNYENFKVAIADKEEQIRYFIDHGLDRKSKSITFYNGNQAMGVTSEVEKLEDKIESLEASIVLTRRFVKVIDTALDKIKEDPYFEIIKMKYYEGKSREQIAEFFEVDVSTITRNKNRLINTLKINLFSDEVIMELFT